MRNLWSFLLFLSIVLLITGLIHLFLYRGLVRGLGISSPAVLWPLRLLAVLLTVSYPLARWMDSWAPDGVVTGAHWISSVWIGLMLHLLWAGILLWLIKAVLWATGAWGRLGAHHATLGRSAVGVVVLTALVLGVIGVMKAYGPARVRYAKVPVKQLSHAAARTKIVMIADFHAGVLAGRREVDRWVGEINALAPDLILVPGDIIDHPPDRIADVAAAFRGLKAPLGVFACTGNHEYIVGVKRAVAFLEEAGMRVLRNQGVELPGGLVIAGIDDASSPRFDIAPPPVETVLGERAARKTTILLNHTPGTAATHAAMDAGADLVVSGHTHGGQIWPFGYITRAAFPFHHGLYPVGDGHQLTTCGIGFWGPPMRLGADPEIWVIELIRKRD